MSVALIALASVATAVNNASLETPPANFACNRRGSALARQPKLRHHRQRNIIVHGVSLVIQRYARVKSRNGPANSSQKPTRPGAGSPAEPASQHTRMSGVTAGAGR